MKEVKYGCEVLTPLFMGGAEPRLKPELRAPSIRGAMRYWYRALAGGSTSINSKISALQKSEEELFGSTQLGSSVSLLVTSAPSKPGVFQKDRAIQTAQGYLPIGKDYLLWSMAASGGRPGDFRYSPPHEFIQPGTEFTVKLRSRSTESVLARAHTSFWLLANLGALGARAQRGAGSFQAMNSSNFLPSFRLCASPENLATFLAKGIGQCLSVIGGESAKWRDFDDQLTPFDILSPGSATISVVASHPSGWNSYMDALNGLGEALRDFRSYRRPKGVGRADHDAVLNWMSKGKDLQPELKRVAFGLPIPFSYSQGSGRDVIQSETSDRRASPLHIRITRLSTGKYVGVLTLFKSEFLGKRENGKLVQLQLQSRKWTAPPPQDYQVIEDFIQSFPQKWSVAL